MKSINHYIFKECKYGHEITENTWNIEYQHANISQMNSDHTSSTPPFCHNDQRDNWEFSFKKKNASVFKHGSIKIYQVSITRTRRSNETMTSFKSSTLPSFCSHLQNWLDLKRQKNTSTDYRAKNTMASDFSLLRLFSTQWRVPFDEVMKDENLY